MKHLVTLFITLSSCCTAISITAMENPNIVSLQRLALEKKMATWEQEMHNAHTQEERLAVRTQMREFFTGKESLQELSHQSLPSVVDSPKNNGKAWIESIGTDLYELRLSAGVTSRIFRTYAPVSKPLTCDITYSASLSPDNRYLAIVVETLQQNGASQYRIDILEVAHSGLLPVGNMPINVPFRQQSDSLIWNDQGIIIGSNQQYALCKYPLVEALKNTIDQLEWIELTGLKKLRHQTLSALKVPCLVLATGIVGGAVAVSLALITQRIDSLHQYPIPLGN